MTTISETEKFLTTLTGSPESSVWFQIFDDSPEKRKNLARSFPSTLNEALPKLTSFSVQGAGVFACINKCEGQTRANKNIAEFRSLFVDLDGVLPPEGYPEASIECQSARGMHIYYLLEKDEIRDPATFRACQKVLISFFKADAAIHDPARVMRLPGYPHQKDKSRPFMVKLKKCENRRFKLKELFCLFPGLENAVSESSQKIHTSESDSGVFAAWAEALPVKEGTSNTMGGRNRTVLILCREGLGCGLSGEKLEQFVRLYCEKSGLDQKEALDILKRQARIHAEKPFVSLFVNASGDELDEAKRFLQAKYRFDEFPEIHLWQGDVYKFASGVYSVYSRSDLKQECLRYLQESGLLKRRKKKTEFINLFHRHVEALIHLDAQAVSLNCDLSDRSRRRYVINTKNGMLIFDSIYSPSNVRSEDHSAKWFTTNQMPFAYDPSAECPRFKSFLNEMLPDQEAQSLLFEFFGLCLVPITTFGKALILVGEGANGKSVIVTVLAELLGPLNTSYVGLEAFNPARTFPLAATVGKLANIVEDMNEIEKVAEGLLKSFVTGAKLTVERKHRDPQNILPTARLVFATNNLPRFTDSSEGIYRRLIVLPMRNQLLDPSKQDRNLIDGQWWRDSGELPGIFNEALKGLARLMKRGRFQELDTSLNEITKLRVANSSSREFLTQFLECAQESESMSTRILYIFYQRFCKENGYHSCASNRFAREVERSFPGIQKSQSKRRDSVGKRTHFWLGLKEKEQGILNELFPGNTGGTDETYF
jgi:P4 family phage/plasmid primase-like protien